MTINFDYNFNMEYLLKVYSHVNIEGKGTIGIDSDSFSLYYSDYLLKSNKEFSIKTLEDALNIYFDLELDIDCDYIKFNKEDLENLLKILE